MSSLLSGYSCDFESDDSCNWTAEGNYEDFSFVRVTGKQVAESGSMQFPTSDRKGDNSTHFFGAERVKYAVPYAHIVKLRFKENQRIGI